MSRTESSIKNLLTALAGQMCSVLISFAARMVFLHYLSEEYLGLDGLFGNILRIFSLAELGIGTSINFSLYKPLAQNDREQIKSLMRLYKRAYILIGSFVAIASLAFTPYYTFFLAEIPDIPHLTVIYWLFSANTALSYFYAYKRALVICDEKRYIATAYRYFFYIFMNLAQMAVLALTRNYILFLLVQLGTTLAENFAISGKANKLYPYLREKDVQPIPRETVHEIKKDMGAMVFHKIGGMVVFSSDNLMLSKFVGLVQVGLYSNYYLITSSLDRVITQIFDSMSASVGNMNATEDPEKLEKAFDKVFFLNFWIYGFASCCLWNLFNPFISIWLGEDLLFDSFTVFIIVVNFYLTGMRKACLTFWQVTGAFYYDRYKPLFEITINIVTSIFLAKRLGTAGIFLGTIISTLCTCIWVEPHVLYKHVFKKHAWGYAGRFIIYVGLSFLGSLLVTVMARLADGESVYVTFLVRAALCVTVPNLLFLAVFGRSENFAYFVRLSRKMLRRIKP